MLTRLGVQLGLASDEEEAGNLVVRFLPEDLTLLCGSLGLSKTRWTRYLMRYGHPPAGWWRAFDLPVVYGAARAAFLLVAAKALGRWGNKLAFVATRPTDAQDASTSSSSNRR